MRRRKPAPATLPQHIVLVRLHALRAISEATAARATPGMDANALNRCFSRGWVGRTTDRSSWWMTPQGSAELAAQGALEQADG